MIPNLRKCQYELKDSIKSTLKNHNQIIAVAPTGFGKTIVIGDIVLNAIKRGHRVLILVHREEILYQTIKKLIMFGIEPGIIQGKMPITKNQVQVAMVQSLIGKIELLKMIKFKLVMIDECHHSPAVSYGKIIQAMPQAKIIGFTATPQRTDGQGMDTAGYTAMTIGPHTHQLVNGIEDWDGKKHKFLVEPIVYSSPMTAKLMQAKWKFKNGDYDKQTSEEIMGQRIIINDTVDMYNKYFNGSPCVIFCTSIPDCHKVYAAMTAEGWTGGVVESGMDSDERKDYIEGLGNGGRNFLCSYEVLGEGVDIPVLAGIISRRKTSSLIVWLQSCGRALRLAPGKKYAPIIDQTGNVMNPALGHPLEQRRWTLEGIKRNKKNSEEGDLIVTQCRGCGVWLAGRPEICPYCGETIKRIRQDNQKIITIEQPLEIIKPPIVNQDSNYVADVIEYSDDQKEEAIINRIKNQHITKKERLDSLASMIGKDRKWTNTVWKKYCGGV